VAVAACLAKLCQESGHVKRHHDTNASYQPTQLNMAAPNLVCQKIRRQYPSGASSHVHLMKTLFGLLIRRTYGVFQQGISWVKIFQPRPKTRQTLFDVRETSNACKISIVGPCFIGEGEGGPAKVSWAARFSVSAFGSATCRGRGQKYEICRNKGDKPNNQTQEIRKIHPHKYINQTGMFC
jgi:hypothetical protein